MPASVRRERARSTKRIAAYCYCMLLLLACHTIRPNEVAKWLLLTERQKSVYERERESTKHSINHFKSDVLVVVVVPYVAMLLVRGREATLLASASNGTHRSRSRRKTKSERKKEENVSIRHLQLCASERCKKCVSLCIHTLSLSLLVVSAQYASL